MWDADKKTNNVWLTIADLPTCLHATVVDSKEYVSDIATTNMRLIPSGTLLVSFKLTLGRLSYAGTDLYSNEAIASLLDIDESRIQKRFLYWALSGFDWDKAAEGDQKIKGKTLNKAKLKRIPIPLPLPEEQRRIIAVLDEAFEGLDRARTHVEANLHDAREMLDSAIDEVFSESDWRTETLKELAHADCSLSYGIVQPGGEVSDGLPIVRPTDLTRRTVDLRGLKRIDPRRASSYGRTTLIGGELLLCVRGSTGTVSLAAEELCGANVTRGIVPVRLNSTKIDIVFAYYQFLSRHVQDQIASKTYGAALMQINIRDLRKLNVFWPSLEEQTSVVKRLEAIEHEHNHLCRGYEGRLSDLDNLRQSLLQRAFAGELT